MSLYGALALLLAVAAGIVIWLEVTREVREDLEAVRTWRTFLAGALGGAVLAALVFTLAIFRQTIS